MNILTAEQQEGLQEIANIGMGQAGASIATILDEFVVLSIPNVVVLQPGEISQQIVKIVGDEIVSAVRQAFHSTFRGEAIVIYHYHPGENIADLMGYDSSVDTIEEYEIILDITNILVGACLGGIAAQLAADIGFSAPSIMAEHVPANKLFSPEEIGTSCALFIEVNFALESRNFSCHLIVLLPEQEISILAQAVDQFIEKFG